MLDACAACDCWCCSVLASLGAAGAFIYHSVTHLQRPCPCNRSCYMCTWSARPATAQQQHSVLRARLKHLANTVFNTPVDITPNPNRHQSQHRCGQGRKTSASGSQSVANNHCFMAGPLQCHITTSDQPGHSGKASAAAFLYTATGWKQGSLEGTARKQQDKADSLLPNTCKRKHKSAVKLVHCTSSPLVTPPAGSSIQVGLCLCHTVSSMDGLRLCFMHGPTCGTLMGAVALAMQAWLVYSYIGAVSSHCGILLVGLSGVWMHMARAVRRPACQCTPYGACSVVSIRGSVVVRPVHRDRASEGDS
eukprot:jgi/Ulvmu1/5352/UM022_0146.1